MTFAYTPALVQTQAYVPVQPVIPTQYQQTKPLTPEQIVFTIVNSELAKFKRAGQTVDAKTTRITYQQHYTGWTRDQLLQAAFTLVQIYDQNSQQWRLVQNEQELRAKQVQFSKKYHFWKNRNAN
jgi:hypothetical protein